MGYSPTVKATDFDSVIVGSIPTTPVPKIKINEVL